MLLFDLQEVGGGAGWETGEHGERLHGRQALHPRKCLSHCATAPHQNPPTPQNKPGTHNRCPAPLPPICQRTTPLSIAPSFPPHRQVTEQIRQRTGHLPGVAIAVMGCIVNGPGEMADADFGYVGGAPGKIDLYVGKEVVKRAIPMEGACDELVQLIKDHGRWVEPAKEEEPAAVAA